MKGVVPWKTRFVLKEKGLKRARLVWERGKGGKKGRKGERKG